MNYGRRSLLAAGMTLAAVVGTKASACSLTVPERPRRFNDAVCRRQIDELVSIFNRAPSMTEEAVDTWLEERNVEFDDDLLWSDSEQAQLGPADFIRNFKMSGGQLDTKPIRLTEVSLIKNRGNLASYAFTLRRYSYTPADPQGCNGLFTHDEFWDYAHTGYIAAFTNNRMDTLRAFPEWFSDA
ncbi:MAG: hypothetical protein JHD10_09815 [Sphingomonadaceae bacterium]|nr:hypothetical protein [Sphingomonadaceae bacterium]